ncbi:MAG: hypothetical protein PHY31_02630, partial [Smithellaceae bacterium]|nr:hypothetical protein [Smithellaceae bacterium]
RWDRLNREGLVVGIGESDNHDTLSHVLGRTISVFPFVKAFRFVRTHIMTDKPLSGNKDDIPLLLKALRSGRAYVAQEYFRCSKGFSFSVSSGSNDAAMGDRIPLHTNTIVHIQVPSVAKICLVRDGAYVAQEKRTELSYRIDRGGVYRVEVYLPSWGRYRPWIFSNPIFVGESP